jgi:putative ABC transport system ATP-binding protein
MKGMKVYVKDLIRVYRLGNVEVQALRGLNMEVEDGEMISVIGPSGSGKTTLLNIVGGLDQATAGLVRVGDVEVTALDPSQLVDFRRRTVGHVFQTLNLIATLTAAENVELPMIAAGASRGSRQDRVQQLLATVGLSDRAHHKPDELSGGEQQRVAIGAALANDPPVLLADEPTGELDTVNAKIVVDYLARVNEELGKTIIMVTHDPNIARVADRILKIEDGVIKAALTPAQVVKEEATVSYVDHLRSRVSDIEQQLLALDDEFKAGKLSGDQYVERRQNLKQMKTSLNEELHRLGVVT